MTINAPRFITTALETDVNGSTLLDTEAIHHTLTLSNTGTATGTTVAVQISWSSGALFTTGSLIFQTGTTVNTGTLIIDEISHTIHFTIPAF